MRVAIVTETFLPKIDGIVTMVTKTVETLQARGDEVMVFAPRGGPAELYGAEVVSLPSIPFPVLSGAECGGAAGVDAETSGEVSAGCFSFVRAFAAGHRRNLLRQGAARPDCDFVSHESAGVSALLQAGILRGSNVEADAGAASAGGSESVHVDADDGRTAPA